MDVADIPVVAETLYQHDQHGTVEVLDYDADHVHFIDPSDLSRATAETTETFVKRTEPATMGISASAESLTGDEPSMGVR